MINLWHIHQWLEAERAYAPPVCGEFKSGSLTQELARMVLFGCTTIILRCKECGALKTTSIPGKIEAVKEPPR